MLLSNAQKLRTYQINDQVYHKNKEIINSSFFIKLLFLRKEAQLMTIRKETADISLTWYYETKNITFFNSSRSL